MPINILGVFDQKYIGDGEKSQAENDGIEEEIGGLFKKVSKEQERVKIAKHNMDLNESSLIMPWSSSVDNWMEPLVGLNLKYICFSFNCHFFELKFRLIKEVLSLKN